MPRFGFDCVSFLEHVAIALHVKHPTQVAPSLPPSVGHILQHGSNDVHMARQQRKKVLNLVENFSNQQMTKAISRLDVQLCGQEGVNTK